MSGDDLKSAEYHSAGRYNRLASPLWTTRARSPAEESTVSGKRGWRSFNRSSAVFISVRVAGTGFGPSALTMPVVLNQARRTIKAAAQAHGAARRAAIEPLR